MTNPFYVSHLKHLMSGDAAAQENVIPQLYHWLTTNRMSEEDFTSCMNAILDRAEEAAIRENETFVAQNETFVAHVQRPVPVREQLSA